jgi:hypothetical protein
MKKALFCTLLLFSLLAAVKITTAQAYCYNCSYDSLVQEKQKAITATEKLRVLTWMAELNSDTITLNEITKLSRQVPRISLSYDIITKGHGGTLWVERTQAHDRELYLSFNCPLHKY